VGAQASLTTTLRGDDKVSATLHSAADAALKLASAEVEAAKKAEAASEGSTKAKKAQVSASKQVALAIAQEAAAGNPLKSKLAELNAAHATLKAQMTALVKAGKPIPPQMAAAAAAAEKASAAIKRQSKVQKTAATSGVNLTDSIKAAAVAYVSLAAAARAATALKDLVTDHIEAGDALSKMSQRLGVSVEKLQEYQFTASSAGIANEQLADAFKALGRRAADAAAGNKEFGKGFEMLGVDVETASGRLKTVEELLPEIADGLAAQADQGVRASASMRVLGDSGVKLLPMLQGGSAELERYAARAHEVGAVMSDETAAAAETAAQAFTELDAATGGLKTAVAAELVPAVTDLAKGLTEIASWGVSADIAIGGLKGTLLALAGPAAGVAASFISIAGAVTELSEEEKFLLEQEKQGEADRLKWEREQDARARAELSRIEARKKANEQASKELLKTRAAEEKELAAAAAAREAEQQKETAASLKMLRQVEAEKAKIAEKELAAAKQQQDELAALAKTAKEESIATAEATADKWITVGTDIGATFVTMFSNIAEGEKTAGEIAGEAMASLLAMALQTASEFMAIEAAKAAAAAFAAHAGIGPFIGLAIGAAAAATAAAAVMSFANFAEGGLVTGGQPGRDSVPALLMPGELVIPTDQTDGIRRLLGMAGSGAPLRMADGGVVINGDAGNTTSAGATIGTVNEGDINLTISASFPTDAAGWDQLTKASIIPSLKRLQKAGQFTMVSIALPPTMVRII